MSRIYSSYNKYHIIYDTDVHSFDIYYNKKMFVKNARIENICSSTGMPESLLGFSSFKKIRAAEHYEDNALVTIEFLKENEEEASLRLALRTSNKDVCLTIGGKEKVSACLTGEILCEDFDNTFPVCPERAGSDIRCAVGKASGTEDHAVYNKLSDYVVSVGKRGQTIISPDTLKRNFTFITKISDESGAKISYQEDFLAKLYDIKFSPINRNTVFPNVPVGWMTWYAVKFGASEEKVLTNAKWQAENLSDYGANAVWVDWEWYHDSLKGIRDDGVNSLNPDPQKYPHGMKYVADKIKEMGLTPAIWLGLTNEPCKNEFIEKYPDIVLVDNPTWCGRYFMDPTHPDYLNKYLPTALANVHKWGYEAVKFDTIPISFSIFERNHENMYDPSLTTYEIYRKMIKKIKSQLGENFYMLSCSGSTNSSILWGSDIFDSARIGEDIFSWDHYLKNIKRIMDFYPLHNIQLFADPDNVVLRDEFNVFEQAKARVALVSLLGLPMTFGDEFSVLSEEKINLIKKTLPILDIHPADLCKTEPEADKLIINLAIDSFEKYQVSGIFNHTDSPVTHRVDIAKDLHLEKERYFVYDFFRDELIEPNGTELTLDFVPYECRILALRKVTNAPQIVSTSRHITQGAAEITKFEACETKIKFTSSLVKNDSYIVTFYVPEGYSLKDFSGFETKDINGNLLRLTLVPSETGEYDFSVTFQKN